MDQSGLILMRCMAWHWNFMKSFFSSEGTPIMNRECRGELSHSLFGKKNMNQSAMYLIGNC
jgi:hypothetical protein